MNKVAKTTQTLNHAQAYSFCMNHDDAKGLIMVKGVKGKREKLVSLYAMDSESCLEDLANTKADKFYVTTKD